MGTMLKNIPSVRYPSYKDSGVEWLGEIPSSWSLTRLGTRFEERKTKVSDKDFPPLSVTKNGTIPQLDSAAKSNDGDNRKLVKTGDFVINSRSDRKGSSGIAYQDGSVSLIYIVIEPKGINPTYCNYLLKSYNFVEEFYRMGHGIVADLWTTRYDEMKAIVVGIPTIEEQTAIAAFLDRKTALIDQAIEIKQKQIELLKERRQILIHKAVTRGLNPNVKMKDSGVEWIGEIPEGWEVKRLKTLLQEGRDGIRIGPFGSAIKSEILKPVGYKIYGQEHVIADDFNIGAKYIDDNDFKRLSNYELFAGDIVITMMGTTGKCKVVPNNIERGIMDSHLIRVRTKINNANPEFVSFLINDSKYIFNQIKLRSKGSIMEGLNSSIVKSLHLLLPPLNEQRTILLNIDETNSKFNTAISLKEQEIEKLKEYKASLINSAVTGKIKVS